VRLYQRHFDDFAMQRNAALHEVSYANPWFFFIDADEVCPLDLAEEILRETSQADDEVVVFHLRRRDYFRGKWMKHTTMYPVWFERVMRPDQVKFRGEFSEKLVFSGEERYLTSHLDHYPFDKGLDFWVERHNRYSTLQAEINMQQRAVPISWKALCDRNPLKRRAEMKRLYQRIPCKWLLYLLYNFFCKMCFLHGRDGLQFILLRSYYEYLVEMKTIEGLHR
jgi:hypothetical protein